MSRETWADRRVVHWVDEHAVPLQWDVTDPATPMPIEGISAVPTVLLFRDSREE